MRDLTKVVSKHSPTILTIVGVVSMVGTVVLAVHETPKARQLMDEKRAKLADQDIDSKIIEQAKIYSAAIPAYLPSIGTGVFSVACFLGANKIHIDRQTALFGAYTIADRSLETFKEEAKEKLGADGYRELEESVARKKLEKSQEYNEVYVLNDDERLFQDGQTMQVFKSTVSDIREAEYLVNKELGTAIGMEVQLNYFLSLLGCSTTDAGRVLGWDITKLHGDHVDVQFVDGNLKDGTPVWILKYEVSPIGLI